MVAAIRPSAPIRNRYEARVHALLDIMSADVIKAVKRQWQSDEPETVLLGSDKSPSELLRELMRRLGKHWQSRFDELADNMADYFSTAVQKRCDLTLAAQLRKAGMSVRFKMTAPMRDAFNAVRAENVSLIKSIGQQHLAKVEQLVMQSVSQGRADTVSLASITNVGGQGVMNLETTTGEYRVNGTKVVGARKTGWAAATGTATRTTFDTATVTTAQLAERVKALIDDLYATAGHGLLGA